MQGSIMFFSVWFRTLLPAAMSLNFARVKRHRGESHSLLFFHYCLKYLEYTSVV